MFGKEGAEQQAAVSSILGNGCKFTGDVDAKGTIRVDGEFDGKIVSTDSVVVGKGGIVKGEIHASHAAVSGSITPLMPDAEQTGSLQAYLDALGRKEARK